ncbi:sensor histidine kinase [Pseudoalteromonas piscicida]|uniref:histidine kinase n=1 Tax=Pseudoalteromonas piscicida TaxID=43662 RepID=A0AAD0RGF0_PSEO7|nr:HAMP domain-containing sensor histidine kinase [Pseudoalteromonas piscicida]ASD65726.1 two-component sensor histidine kinase [Pseudoalteromonas piscicida]AXR00761.1 sensor histidine kinase [Pseudoalteromonas piscicida]
MHLFKEPLARYFIVKFLLLIAIEIAGVCVVSWQMGINIPIFMPLPTLLLIAGLIVCQGLLLKQLYNRCKLSFERCGYQAEAWLKRDFSLKAKPTFSSGVVAQLHNQLNALSDMLQSEKTDEDMQSFLVAELISVLNTPMLIFDQRMQLCFGNDACFQLFQRPWQTLRYSHPEAIGLTPSPQWHFIDIQNNKRWQVRHSTFTQQNQSYHLVVCIDIQQALRDQELQAWQRLIRVISHEIRNSLTPVSAILERLQTRAKDPRDHEAFNIVLERCFHLQDFIHKYSQLNQPIKVEIKRLSGLEVSKTVQGLFTDVAWQIELSPVYFHVDPTLFNQVLINIIKNAIEASPAGSVLTLKLYTKDNIAILEVLDEGTGVANHDNLFVPFYSTKQTGEGIGLYLSRYFVEQMSGSISLSNRQDKQGSVCQLTFPVPLN